MTAKPTGSSATIRQALVDPTSVGSRIHDRDHIELFPEDLGHILRRDIRVPGDDLPKGTTERLGPEGSDALGSYNDLSVLVEQGGEPITRNPEDAPVGMKTEKARVPVPNYSRIGNPVRETDSQIIETGGLASAGSDRDFYDCRIHGRWYSNETTTYRIGGAEVTTSESSNSS